MAGGLFKTFTAGVTRSSAGVPNTGSIPPLGAVPSASGLLVSQATSMTDPTVYACVSIRSSDVARCTPRLFAPDGNGGRLQVDEHPVARLFRRPNRIQTWFEYAEQQQMARDLRGNSYAAVLRDGRGRPTELIPINPDAVMVMEAVDGSIFYNVNRLGLFQMSVLRGFPPCIPAENIIHLRGFTFNMLAGASTIGLARDSIGLSMAQDQQASRFVGNGARPAGVIESPKKLTKEAADRLKASWDAFNSGIQNVGRTAVLEEGMQWKQLQLTSVDLEFNNTRTFQVSAIARFWRVPLSKLGVASAASSKITPAEEEQGYVNNTVMPELARWEQKLAQYFELDDEGLEVDFDESQLLRADIMTRYTAARIGVLSGMVMPSEFRRDEGLPFVEGSDKLLAPVNLAALGSDMTGSAPDGAGRPAGGALPNPTVPTSGGDAAVEPQGEL